MTNPYLPTVAELHGRRAFLAAQLPGAGSAFLASAPPPSAPVEGIHHLSVWVPGTPATQGSKDYVGSTRYARESDPRLRGWRSDVREALRAADGSPLRVFTGPTSAGLEFVLPRPRSSKFGDHPAGKPDLDKLTRAVLDAAKSAGVLEDDSRVVAFHRLVKRWADACEVPGCRIEFREVSE